MVDIKFHCDEKTAFIRGYPVRSFTYKDYSIERHTHDFYEVNIVMAGEGTHCIESGKFKVRMGDVFVIPPMTVHAYIDTSQLEVHHILLTKDFLINNRIETEQVKGFLQLTEIEPFLRSNFSNAFFLHLDHAQMISLKNELNFLDDQSDFPWEEYSLMKYHTVWQILYWFSGILNEQINSHKEKNQKSTNMKYEIQIIKSLEYIHKNYGEKISIDALSKEAYMSRSTFMRCFKAICGISPIEYLNNYRCKKAIELLNYDKCSKTEIAHSCGFYDLSHMERMLKKYR